MSKSDPNSAIFMEDTEEDIKRKINKAFCPPKEVFEVTKIYLNPVFDHLAFCVEKLGSATVPTDNGDLTVKSKDELETAFLEKKVTNDEIKVTPSLSFSLLIIGCSCAPVAIYRWSDSQFVGCHWKCRSSDPSQSNSTSLEKRARRRKYC